MSWGYLLVRSQKWCDISYLHEGISWSVTENNMIYHIYMRTWSGVPKRIYNLLHNEVISWSGTPFGGSLHWHWAAWPDQQDWEEDQVSGDNHNGLVIWWSLVMMMMITMIWSFDDHWWWMIVRSTALRRCPGSEERRRRRWRRRTARRKRWRRSLSSSEPLSLVGRPTISLLSSGWRSHLLAC